MWSRTVLPEGGTPIAEPLFEAGLQLVRQAQENLAAAKTKLEEAERRAKWLVLIGEAVASVLDKSGFGRVEIVIRDHKVEDVIPSPRLRPDA